MCNKRILDKKINVKSNIVRRNINILTEEIYSSFTQKNRIRAIHSHKAIRTRLDLFSARHSIGCLPLCCASSLFFCMRRRKINMFIEHYVCITPNLKSIFEVNNTYCLEVKLPLFNRHDFQNDDSICKH